MSGRVGCHGCWKNMESVCASPASAVAITTCRAAPSSSEKPFAECTLQLWGGTFWPQLGRLRRSARLPYLLIEGSDLDRGPLSPAAVRGACLAILDLGITVLWARDQTDSALWLYRLAQRREHPPARRRPAYAQRPKANPGSPAAEAMLASVPGISTVSARALLTRFGNVAAVLAADPNDWEAIAGIGPQKAKSLAETLRSPFGN